MCIAKVKEIIMYWKKPWIDCSIKELDDRQDKRKLMGLSYVISGIIVFAVFVDYYFTHKVIGVSVIGVILSMMLFFIAIDFSNDITRMDIIKLIKRNNGEK